MLRLICEEKVPNFDATHAVYLISQHSISGDTRDLRTLLDHLVQLDKRGFLIDSITCVENKDSDDLTYTVLYKNRKSD